MRIKAKLPANSEDYNTMKFLREVVPVGSECLGAKANGNVSLRLDLTGDVRDQRNRILSRMIKGGEAAKEILEHVQAGMIELSTHERALVEKALWQAEMATYCLVSENEGLINYFAKKKFYVNEVRCLEVDDLAQDAGIGLINAAKRFDEDRGARFSAYACTCIKNEIIADLSRMGSMCISKDAKKQALIIEEKRAELTATYRRKPTSAEIIQAIIDDPEIKRRYKERLNDEKIEQLMRANSTPVSMDSEVGEDGGVTMLELMRYVTAMTPFQSTYANLINEFSVRMVSLLKPDQLEALRVKYGVWDLVVCDEAAVRRVENASFDQINELVASAIETLVDSELTQEDRQYLRDLIDDVNVAD